jgi:hypothetical protein
MSAIRTVRQTFPFPWGLAGPLSRDNATRFTILALHVLVLAVTPSYAEPMLLVEFTYEKTPQFGGEGSPPIRDWEFGFWAGASGAPQQLINWVDSYGIDDIGKNFFATADIVAGANQRR